MLYLVSPYSHADPLVREQRFHAACRAAAALIRAGHVVFAPIVHCHPLMEHGLTGGWDYWGRIDGEFIIQCDEVVVLMLDGWRESRGVRAEIGLAEELGKPVRYLAPEDATGSPTLAPVAPMAATTAVGATSRSR